MAYVNTPNALLIPAVANADIPAGQLVALSNNPSGQLPRATIATATSRVVYVALPEDDSYDRPTDERMYLAGEHGIGDALDSAGWLLGAEQVTLHRVGLASQAQPTIKNGMRMIAAKNCVVTITPNCYVDSTNIKQHGALVTVSATDNGKFAVAGATDTPIGVVVGVYPDNRLAIHVF